MHQKLAILDTPSVPELEPPFVEVHVVLESGESATFSIDVFTAQRLIAKLEIPADGLEQEERSALNYQPR